MGDLCKSMLRICEPMIERFESIPLEYGIMAMYAFLGNLENVHSILKQQLSVDRRSVTLLSLHLLMVSHLVLFEKHCQRNGALYSRHLEKTGTFRETKGVTLTDVVSDIVRSFPSYHVAPTRITYDLLINAGSLCDDKVFILDQIQNLSSLMVPARTKFTDKKDQDLHFTLTSRTFAALMYPYIEMDTVREGQKVLRMIEEHIALKSGQKRRDWKRMESNFLEESTTSVAPFLYSFQQDFCDVFDGEKCNSLLKPLYSMKTFNKRVGFEKPDEMVLRRMHKEHKQKHRYLSGISKIRGIKKHDDKKRQAKAVMGRKGKIHKRHNII